MAPIVVNRTVDTAAGKGGNRSAPQPPLPPNPAKPKPAPGPAAPAPPPGPPTAPPVPPAPPAPARAAQTARAAAALRPMPDPGTLAPLDPDAPIPCVEWRKDEKTGRWVETGEMPKGTKAVSLQWIGEDGEWGPQTTAPAQWDEDELRLYMKQKFEGKNTTVKYEAYRMVATEYAESTTDAWVPSAKLIERTPEQEQAAKEREERKKAKTRESLNKLKENVAAKHGGDAVSPDGNCMCGCGEKVARRFKPGHDSRYHSMERKLSVAGMAADAEAVKTALKAEREGKSVLPKTPPAAQVAKVKVNPNPVVVPVAKGKAVTRKK